MIIAEIIPIGSELLLGGRTDTNSVFLSEMLAQHGIEVRFKSVVGDDLRNICQALTIAARRAKVVIVTGGLGPTVDDLVREAVAKVMGRELRRRNQAMQAIKDRFLLQGRSITKNQYRQAFLPTSADFLQNSVGTAPGFSLKWKGSRFFCLPGVSHEAKQMFSDAVLPLLLKEGYCTAPIRSRTLHTFGLIEGVVDEFIAEFVPQYLGIRVGLLATPLGVSVSLTEVPQSKNTIRNVRIGKLNQINSEGEIEVLLKRISSRLKPFVYGFDDELMEAVIGKKLWAGGSTIALAESCTGGLIGHRLTQVSGSSNYLERGVVCYSNRSKIDLLGVSSSLLRRHGAVSSPVARAMAKGIRKRSGTVLGLSVTGIAGPTGGTPEKPVGLVYVGLATPDGVFTKEFRFQGNREMVKWRSSQGALDTVRRYLSGLPILD
ncbi:MAG: competence/damage-inducible protein A [Nitrospirota bacterium]|nr:competence/damage-inducible protein A [Nitrospirota bacterium]